MSESDPNVWSGRALQEVFVEVAVAVLHQCIRSLIGAGLLRTIMDISARAISLADRPQRAIWVTSATCARFLGLFDFRPLQQNLPLADVAICEQLVPPINPPQEPYFLGAEAYHRLCRVLLVIEIATAHANALAPDGNWNVW